MKLGYILKDYQTKKIDGEVAIKNILKRYNKFIESQRKNIGKKDWSSYCVTNSNRNQCNEGCVIFPICRIKKKEASS